MKMTSHKTLLTLILIAFGVNAPILWSTQAQTWVTDVSLKTARWNHTATLLPNGKVLIAGGEIFNDNTNGFFKGTNNAELYNPVTGASTLTAPMNDAHWLGSATLLTNGLVLVAGGRNNGGSVVASAELYDPTNGTWTPTGSLHQPRASFSSALLPNGKLLVVAGQNDGAVDQSSAELYDPVSGTWATTTSPGYATDTGAAVLLPNGKVLFCGGGDGGGGSLTNAVLYNPANETWTNTAPMHFARGGHAAILLTNGQVLVVGGAFGSSAELYNPTTGSWTVTVPMNNERSFPSAALLTNGQVLVIGGNPGQTDTELYNPADNTWTLAASLHVGRVYNTATALGDGQVVVTGGDAGTIGYYNGPAMADVETYAGHPIQVNHTLVAHYPFDAPSDYGPFSGQLLMDTSGNGYNIDSPSSDDDTYPTVTTNSVAGGSGIQFDGHNYYVLPTNLLTTVAGSFSISLWLQTTQVSGDDTDPGPNDPAIVWGGGASDNYFDSEPMTLTGNKLGFYTGDDQATLHSVSNINSGSFTHIVVTRDQPTGVKKIYVNGVLDTTATGGTNFLSDSTDLILGESFYQGGVTGVVDDVQFYAGILTASDVDYLYANPGLTAPIGLPPSLNFALDNTNLSWTTSGDAPWFGQSEVTHDGESAAQSGSLGDQQSSTLETTVTGPGTLTFWWKLTNGGDDFFMQFYVGSDPQDFLGADTDWTQKTYHLGAGEHDLSWQVFSGNGTSPSDAAYLDEVVFTPDVLPPSPGQWRLTGSLTNAATLQTAVLLTNGLVLVAGGQGSNDIPLASAQLYNPASGTWTGTHSLNTPRYAHTATLLTNGLVLVAGGATNVFDGAAALGSAELYNPVTGNWTPTGDLHTPRYSHSATLLPDGKVLVAGGQSTNAYPNIIASAEIYDPSTGLWIATNSMIEVRYSHTATLLPNGKVLVAGGGSSNVFTVTPKAELFDPASGTWTNAGTMTIPLVNHTATLLLNGKVLIAGGDFDENFGAGFSLIASPFAMLYDPAAGTWTDTTSMNVTHEFHTATLLTNGLVLVAGFGQSGSVTNSSELYNPTTATWTVAAAMNVARHGHTAVLLPSGLVLAVAGQGPNNLASAELYSSIFIPTIILTNTTRLPGGAFQFSFTNTPGAGSTVFYTTNLSVPVTNWTALGSATEISPGLFQFTDSPPLNSRRFYRVRSP